MNRPFGAVDVAANLKGAVPKATTQKILIALAEKGEITQKIYGTPFLLERSMIWPHICALISDHGAISQVKLLFS